MKSKTKSFLFFLTVLILVILACGPPTTVTPTTTPIPPTEIQVIEPTQPMISEATATEEPSPAPESTNTPPQPTATAGPQCLVLQNLNFRAGPGLAYREPIGFVLKDAIVVPTGFNPVGIPGGSWVLINDQGKDGWIAAESNFIDCNFDLATLPSVEVDPPPLPPPPSSVQTSDAEGGCGPDFGNPECVVTISDKFFIQFQLFENDHELTGTDGVEQINFEVREGGENGDTIYETIESTSTYCIFGGDGPCNNWPVDKNVYVWPSGRTVREGEYFIEIFADYNGASFRWAAEFTISLP